MHRLGKLKALACGVIWLLGANALLAQPLADFRRVVVADDAVPVTMYAAEDLASYAGRIGGMKLEIVPLSQYDPAAPGLSFFVGEAAARQVLKEGLAPWKTEEYLLQSVPQGLVLAGQDSPGPKSVFTIKVVAGSHLAVSTLLDDYLGVKWFWPGFAGEHVPSNPKAVIPPLNVRASPPFVIRFYTVGYTTYHQRPYKEEAARWARRTRQGWPVSAAFGHSWDAALLRGIDKNQPPPEWLALVNGKRQGPQVCTTHPHVLEAMTQYVLNSPTDITSISPSDGGGFCQCDEQTKSQAHKQLGIPSCTSLDVPGVMAHDGKTIQLSDRMFTYANEVARRVRAKNPDKGVNMFAYVYYKNPPLKIKTLEPNIYLSFVNQAMSHVDPEAEKEWKESIAGWQKLSAKMIMREGWGNHYLLDMPFIHARQVLNAIPYAHRQGFVAVYGEGSKAFSTQAPTSWAVMRMMWDPTQDVAKVMDEYYDSAYGPVAAEMRQFFGVYEQAVNENWPKRRFIMDSHGFPYVNVINSWHIVFPASVVDEAEKHLKAAEAKVATAEGEYKDRLVFHRFGQNYTRMMLELLDCYRQLNNLGFKMDSFVAEEQTPQDDPARRKTLLQRAYELGEQREEMVLAHRDWAAIDEGMYGRPFDGNFRQWHVKVKKELGIDKPSTISRATLTAPTPKEKK